MKPLENARATVFNTSVSYSLSNKMAKNVLEVSNLTKRYGDFLAVDGISFELKEGEVLGLLGPNGAGKTTTIQILLGLTTADSGTIRYFGKEFPRHREWCLSRINFASAYAKVQGRITVRQNLRIFSGLYEVKDWRRRIEELSSRLRINPLLDTKYDNLSSGEKTRVHLVKALLNSPRLILMDEPTASLDPEIKNDVIDLIRELQREQNVSILYTSHDMAEVSRICDRVMFLSKGKIEVVDTPIGLTKLIEHSTLTLTFDGKKGIVTAYLREKGFDHKYLKGHVVEIWLPEDRIPKVLFGLSSRNIWITSIDINKPDLEDVFLNMTRGKR